MTKVEFKSRGTNTWFVGHVIGTYLQPSSIENRLYLVIIDEYDTLLSLNQAQIEIRIYKEPTTCSCGTNSTCQCK